MFSPASENDWYFDELLGVADDPDPENWVKVEPSMLYPCDKCEDFYELDDDPEPHAQKRNPAIFLNTDSEEAWCADCIELHSSLAYAASKDD